MNCLQTRTPVWFGVIVSMLSAGCFGQKPATKGSESETTSVEVAITHPQRMTIQQIIGQPGVIEAFEKTAIYPKVSGYVKHINRDMGNPIDGPLYDSKGHKIQPGTLLVELDAPELVEQLKQKQAQMERAAEEITQAMEMERVAQAALESGRIKVKEIESGRARCQAEMRYYSSESKRLEELVNRKVVEIQNLELAQFKAQGAAASLEELESKVQSALVGVKELEAQERKAVSDIKVAQAKHKAAAADRDYAAAMVQYLKIEAPYNGFVIKRNVNTGDLYQPPSSSAARGEPLFWIAQASTVRIFAEVPEVQASLINDQTKARVRPRSVPGKEWPGRVIRDSIAFDAKARTLRVEIDLENPKLELRPGTYAFVDLVVQHDNVMSIPFAAVALDGDQAYCFRVVDNTAVRTPIQVGIQGEGNVEITGIKIGADWTQCTGNEEIISNNVRFLADGQAVKKK